MALPNDVISLERLRQSVGMVGDEMDSSLIPMRDTAIAIIEKIVGRNIIDRDGFESDACDFEVKRCPISTLIFRVPDVKLGQFTLHYAQASHPPTGRASEIVTYTIPSDRVYRATGEIHIYGDVGMDWKRTLRTTHPTPFITANVGMEPFSIPSAWGDGVALIVRAILDGSAFDTIAQMSSLQMCLGPWVRMPFSQFVRT